MGDDVLYAASGGDSNKRKYDDSSSPVARRATGFSSAADAGPPPSFDSVPPPMNEIELAKQKAQEIAARLLNNSDPTKRARVESVGNGGRGFDSSDYGSQKPSGYGFGAPSQAASSGYPGPSKRIEVPNGRVGVIIGKGGETIKYLQLQSGAKIQVTRDVDADPNSATRGVDLMGTADQISKAEQLIQVVLSDAETSGSGSGSGSRRMGGPPSGAAQHVMKIPNNKVGLVIGKGGETIKSMQARTGARIQVIPLHLPPGDLSQERTVQIDGTSEQIEAAKQIVDEVISENRNRNSTMSGGGYPQQGYQSRPPSNWGQPGAPMQQPGYSYPQAGAYPGQPPQYQSPYSGYPPQPTSSGYPTGWDQSAATQTQAVPQGAGAYDYYNQQQQQPPQGGLGAAPADASGYGYGAAYAQAPAYSQGQGYTQYGYGSYQGGAGYDSQQQGYSSKTSNASNPAPEGQTASYGTQDEANQDQPAANPNYPPQASNQAGYAGPPQSQKPPQQSPGSQGSAAAYTQQPGYSSSQSQSVHAAYAQSAAAYAAASQPGYGAPPSYAAAPAAATQPGYGQQQPAAYNNSYGGGGYSQPPAYPSSADGGAYDSTTPPPQLAPPTGSAKASRPT